MLATFTVEAKGIKVGEIEWVEKTAIEIYRMTAQLMNCEVTDYFNKDPRWINKPFEEGSEQWNEYGKLMMNIAEVCSKWIGVKNGRIVKLCGGLDCLLLEPTGKKHGSEDIYKGIIQCKVEDYPMS